MKKFEEELFSEVPCKFGLSTEGEYKQSILVKHFGDWVSPEDHQAEIDKRNQQYEEYQEIYSKTAKKLNEAELELSQLKSQLEKQQLEFVELKNEHEVFVKEKQEFQESAIRNARSYAEEVHELKSQLEKQPEIPEVPQFVADWLDRKPIYAINGFIPVEIIEWSKKQTGYADLGMNINLLLKLKVNGYTVAKEKRFYLKHIDFCKRDKDYDWYMIKHSDGPLNHLRVEKETLPPTVDTYFTQSEIDSMETGSYEQIPVEENK